MFSTLEYTLSMFVWQEKWSKMKTEKYLIHTFICRLLHENVGPLINIFLQESISLKLVAPLFTGQWPHKFKPLISCKLILQNKICSFSYFSSPSYPRIIFSDLLYVDFVDGRTVQIKGSIRPSLKKKNRAKMKSSAKQLASSQLNFSKLY